MILQSSRLLRTNSATSKPELPRSMISSRIRSGHSWLMAAMAALHVAALRICSGGVTVSSSCVSSCRSVYSSSTTRMSMAIYASSCFFRGHVRTIRVPLPNALCMSTSASGPKNSFSRSVTFCTPEPPA